MKEHSDGTRSALNTFVCSLGYTEKINVPGQFRLGIITVVVTIGIFMFASNTSRQMGLFWVLGIGFGFVLQRSRFCFASAFRDMFLLRHGRNLKGLLVGLAVATLGFANLMARQVPNTALGIMPPDANVLPLGLHILLGGLMFGLGMVVAGGCVSGSIYRMGEGYVASWVAFGGIILGLLLASFTWNWWWEAQIADGPRIWLPNIFGHTGSLLITLGLLGLVYLVVIWWESRGGITIPDMPFHAEDEDTFAVKLNNTLRRVFVHGWPAATGGVALGMLNNLSFQASRPWGFTGEISRWAIGFTNWIGYGPGTLLGTDQLPGCTLEQGDDGILHFMLFLVVGMLVGSFIAALFAGEFKIRIPKQPVRWVQAGGGGLTMGYGAGIAMGCTIGGLFSAIPSLALNGWIFAIFLACGAWLGTQVIRLL